MFAAQKDRHYYFVLNLHKVLYPREHPRAVTLRMRGGGEIDRGVSIIGGDISLKRMSLRTEKREKSDKMG